jgi:hypothetical protein
MAGDKLPNGWATASLTTAGINFAVTAVTLAGFDGGDLPDTTTNLNTTYRSKGTRKFIEVQNVTLTAAFRQNDYTAMPSVINVQDTLTITDVEGTTDVYSVITKSFVPGEMTEDGGMPTADVEFTVLTGVDGDTGPVITIPA